MHTVMVLGASGIIGQTIRDMNPSFEKSQYVYCCKQEREEFISFDCNDWDAVVGHINKVKPSIIVNMAGEARVDKVEKNPSKYLFINVELPRKLAEYCHAHNKDYIHISTQAVFSGNEPPYFSHSEPDPINQYGIQKARAEKLIKKHERWTIIRPTFVLGIRPQQDMGRSNPLEDILGQREQEQVWDRYFSPCFAFDIARSIINTCVNLNLWPQPRGYNGRIFHCGLPLTLSRYLLAVYTKKLISPTAIHHIKPVMHESFHGLALRPFDTTYGEEEGLENYMSLEVGIRHYVHLWRRMNESTV